MRVLVTGNKGYIGSVMSEYLTLQGYDVFGLDTDYFKSCSLFSSPQAYTNAKDVRELLIEDFIGIDAVIYLSALSNDPLGEVRKDVTYDVNWLGALDAAMLAREAGVKRFLFASSCSMYGAGNGDDVLDETSPQTPLTTYAESKVWAENGLQYLATDDFSPVFFRCGTAYGISPRQRLDLVLNSMVASAYKTGKIIVYNGGTAWRPIVHIEDISQAFSLGLSAPRELIHNQAFNVGANEDNYRVMDLAQIVQKAVPGSEIKHVGIGTDTRSYRVSFSKIWNVLEFRPYWRAETGAKHLLSGFEFYGLKEKDENKFIRLNEIKRLVDNEILDEELRWV